MEMLKKSLILGSLLATAILSYNHFNKKPAFVNLLKDGSIFIDYVKTTNFSFENREKIREKLYSQSRASSDPKVFSYAQQYGSPQEPVLNEDIVGRWCNQNKCFLVRARDTEISDKFNPLDEKPSAFIIPESRDNGREWSFHIFLDSSWGKLKTRQSLRDLGGGLTYSRINESYDKVLPLLVVEEAPEGKLPRSIVLDSTGEIDFESDLIPRYEYDKQQRMKDPTYAKNVTDVHNLFEIRKAINAYGKQHGSRPPRLEDLVPNYIERIPEGNWDYDPSRSLEIKKN